MSGVLCDKRMPKKLKGTGLQDVSQTGTTVRNGNYPYDQSGGGQVGCGGDEDAHVVLRGDEARKDTEQGDQG